MIDGEIWKDVEGYDGAYQVSSLGNVRRGHSSSRRYSNEPNVILGTYSQKGYRRIRLFRNGKKKCYFVHRLVAQMFIPKTDSVCDTVNHINHIRHDNRACNLEWTTPKGNILAWCIHYLKSLGYKVIEPGR